MASTQGEPRSKVALIAGVDGPAGEALAEALRERGFALALGARDGAAAKAAVKAQLRKGARAVTAPEPLRAQAGARALVRSAVETFGGLDVAIACPALGRQRPLARVGGETYEELVSGHLTTTFYCCQAASAAMGESGRGGRLLCVTGAAGITGADFGQVHRASVVGGVAAMVRALAVELRHRKITANAVSLAAPDASLSHPPRPLEVDPPPVPEALIPLVCFLLSDAAASITGQVVALNERKLAVIRPTSSPGSALTDGDWTEELISERWADITR